VHQAFDLAETLRVARGNDCEGPRGCSLHPRKRVENRRLLAPHRAARDEDHPVGCRPEEPEHALAGLAVNGGRRHFERIKLQAARHRHATLLGAEIDQAARRFLALHAETIDVGQHAAEERSNQPIARIRTRRDPAVDHHRLDAFFPAEPQQVRPDLGFHHDEDARLHHPERTADDEGEVEREIEESVHALHTFPGHLLSGNRRRREKQAKARIGAAQLGHDRARREHFSDRDGMNPD
jgi:hypothetical protein